MRENESDVIDASWVSPDPSEQSSGFQSEVELLTHYA